VHAFYLPSAIVEIDIAEHISSMSKGINDQMSDFEKAFREFDIHPESTIKTVARYGIPSNMIQEQERDNFADVIIMGTTGSSISKNVVLGSVAIAVLDKASCPVICIPEKTELAPPNHIMFATDYNNVSNLEELLFLKEIAELHNARISIVNIEVDKPVNVSVEDEVEGIVLHNFFGEIEQNYFVHQDEDVETGILNFSNQKRIDLIVTMKREHGFWKNIFHQSVTQGLGLHSNIPLLVLKK
jgi:nucleotide-binding universal stress UspA family protein